MKETAFFCLLAVAAAAVALSASAQDLSGSSPAVQKVLDQMKALAKSRGALAFGLDPITRMDASSLKTIKLKAMVSNCSQRGGGLELPFAVDARRMFAGRAMPGGGPAIVAGVLEVRPKGFSCGGIPAPADFEVDNPVPNSLPNIYFAGTGGYKLAEVAGASILSTASPVPDIGLTVYVRSGEEIAGQFVIDATKQNGGKPTIVVGAIVFSPPPRPGVAVPTFMRAVHLVARSPIGGPNLDIEAAGR